ncbi:MAG: amidohydrolase [Clostridia bacterium]|nr:amidohydrolase [Clostridia bacterium]
MDERQLIERFKWLHRHPELGFEERETTRFILDTLRAEGVETLDTGLPTGAIAVIQGDLPGGVVGLRCDIDALPVQEASGLDYSSEYPGRMHACGHDFHTAVMLGAAALLQEMRAQLRGTVKIIFQPAEELASGAAKVAATGLLNDMQAVFGVHTYPGFQAGTLGIKAGPVMAAPDRFAIVIRGLGTHGAQPGKGIDPIPALASLVLSLQTVVSRAVDPFDPAVLSITHVEAGNTWNVIPGEARLEGTVRTLTGPVRALVKEQLARHSQAIAQAFGCQAELDYTDGPDPVINDPGLCELAAQTARAQGLKVDAQENTMGGEDFSAYLAICPGAFIRVGTGGSHPNHHPAFTADPAALWPAARYCAALARDYLARQAD